MGELKHLVSAETAAAIRACFGTEPEAALRALDRHDGIFAPIERGPGSGRSRCRECGQPIGEGEPCIRFQLDYFAMIGGRFSKTVAAYLHTSPAVCRGREAEGGEHHGQDRD